jgi:hypothetical protein
MILSDYPFSESELRAILKNVLHIRCAFPSFPSGCFGSTIRCILEKEDEGSEGLDPPLVIEDIICKVMPKLLPMISSDSERVLISFPLKNNSVSESDHFFLSTLHLSLSSPLLSLRLSRLFFKLSIPKFQNLIFMIFIAIIFHFI